MQIRVLGSIDVELNGQAVKLAGPKQRAVLAMLALNANATVSLDRMIDGLWGEEPPPTAAKMVQQYVSQLRRLLAEDGGPELVTRGRGYELQVDPAAVDALRFERLVERAAGDDDGSRSVLAREALALWQGPPLSGMVEEPFAASEARRLEELHLVAIELSLEGDLQAGRHAEVIRRLGALVDAHPLREHLRALLMLALYRAGRQADALDAFRDARWTLVETLGLEPGPELRRLQEAILRQDPALELVVPDEAWARRETAEQVGVGTGRALRRRGELRAVEQELAANVIDLQTLRELAEDRRPPTSRSAVCPFKGLESFDVRDAAYFFGRERLVAEIVACLPGTSLIGVIGPSGSGKSSAVRAGLLPVLAAGVLPGSERWTRVLLRPGEQPMTALRAALAAGDGGADPLRHALGRLQSGARLLLVVDQFEELFTVCRDESQRAAFLDAVVGAAERDERLLAVLALRADFYGACAAHSPLAQLLGRSQVLVGAMRPDELARAIEAPAARAGLFVEPELVARLVEEIAGRAGGLPLLSTALLELWQRRVGSQITLQAYERTGGVQGAVARLAEAAYARFGPEEAVVARNILLRLAGGGESDAAVRCRVPLAELDLAGSGPARRVLAVLTDDRLVTIGGETVEVAHEALLREWPRLRGWFREDVEGRRLHRHLTLAARGWESRGRDPGELYRGARLAAALDWAGGHDGALNALERAFLDASRAAGERAQRRLRAVLAAVAFLLLVAVIAGLVALEQRGNAREEATAAAAQRLGAQALAEDDLDLSLLLARQGMALDDSLQTRGHLLAALLKSPAAIGVARGDGDRLISLDVSPNERTLVLLDNDGTLSFLDARTRRRAAPPMTVGGITDVIIDAEARPDAVKFSPDGSRVAVGGGEPVIVDVRTRRVLARVQLQGGSFIYRLYWGRDGRSLYAAVAVPPQFPGAAQRFDARTGRPLTGVRTISRRDTFVTLGFPPAGREVVAINAGGVTTLDARSLRVLRRSPTGAVEGSLSPDGRTLLLGEADGTVRFLDLATGQVTPGSGRHDGAVVRAAFSGDGRTAITAGEDGRLIVWDPRRATSGETLAGHVGQITGLAISRDNATLYSAALDGRALIWDLAGSRRLGRPFATGPGSDEGPRYALRPDGRVLAVGRADGLVALFDARTLRRLSGFRVVPDGPVRGMGYVPDGSLLAVGGDRGFLVLVDPRHGRIVSRLSGHRHGTVFTPGFSTDGRLMAVASDDFNDRHDGIVRLYSLPSGRPLGRPLRFPAVADISLSPDGRILTATRPTDGGVEVFDVPSLRRRASLSDAETVWDFARFTPDGRFVMGGSWKGWVRLWSTRTWKPVTRPFTGHAGRVEWASMSPDGRTLATGGPDGTVRLFDVPTQQPLGGALPGLPNRTVTPQFTPDGAYLFAVYDAGRAYRWDIRPQRWARQACVVAGRRLTRAEWQDALPGREYNPAC